MIELLSNVNWAEVILGLATAVGGIAAVWYRKTLREWRTFWKSVANGLKEIPQLRHDVQGIRYFVSPNGGGSLMDLAARTEAAVMSITEQLEMLTHTIRVESDNDDDTGKFHCNADGENIYVNQTYARWLGVGKADLLGWSFLNMIHPDDVVRVRSHWDECRKENRQYRMTHRMIASSGEVVTVHATATPIPESSNAKKWIGMIRRGHTK